MKAMEVLEFAGWVIVALLTAPLWLPIGVAWCVCTGRTLKGCGAEANAMSGIGYGL